MPRLTFDSEANAAYLYLQEQQGARVETVVVTPDLNVDLNEDGSVVGIEFLNAEAQLGDLLTGKIAVHNYVEPAKIAKRKAAKGASNPPISSL